MPRPGGESDKFGNRYESLWSVDAILDLIEGEYISLTFEPLGDEAAGIEFSGTSQTAGRQYHSIKRQQTLGNWTLGRLAQGQGNAQRSILGDLCQKVKEGAEGVFSSGSSAFELEELIHRAKASKSLDEFRKRISGNAHLSGRFREVLVPLYGEESSAYSALRRMIVRTKNESELIRDVERRVRMMFRMYSGSPIDGRQIRLLIAEFVVEHLGDLLTPTQIYWYLKEHQVLPARIVGDGSVQHQIDKLNQAYLGEVKQLLINQSEITRKEAADACEALLYEEKHVMLEGIAGVGKSCVLTQVIEKLSDLEVPHLVIRLDRLTDDDLSAQIIGTKRRLPESPAITLGEYAGDEPSFLFIDQLDALSVVSARHQSAWGAFNELLEEASTYPKMRLIFACRTFDLNQDARLKKLVSDWDRVKRIRVENLEEDTIKTALKASGVMPHKISPAQLRVLSVPLHLYMFLAVPHSSVIDFSSAGDLFDAFWDHKRREVQERLVGQGPAWNKTISFLCNEMSLRESLVVPEFSLDDYRTTLEAMASESVVHIQQGQVRFFHEAFFDYAFARTFLGSGSDFIQWLASDEQQLFRRSQVRQVLAFFRERETDCDRYLSTLANLLARPDIRFHIKDLIIKWLGALQDPTKEEWVLLKSLGCQLGEHIWSVIRNSVPWFDLLQDMGEWKLLLTSSDENANRTVWLFSMPDVLSARSSVIASLVSPFQGQSEEWQIRLRHSAQSPYGYTSPQMEDLVLALIGDGTMDDARAGLAVNSDWWSIWYTVSSANPVFVAKVLGAWFDRQIQLAVESNSNNPFSNRLDFAPYSQSSGHVIKECARRAPREFVRNMFPRLASLDEESPQQLIAAPSGLGNPDSQLRDELANAMESLAVSDPSELDQIMEVANFRSSRWMTANVLRAWSANPSYYADRIAEFLLEDPEEHLNIGYDVGLGGQDIFVAISRTAVFAATKDCTEESYKRIEGEILNLTPDWELENRVVGRTRLALLRVVDRERLSGKARQHIQELERRFPTVPEQGAPKLLQDENFVWTVGPPIPVAAQQLMSDDDWLSAMEQYGTERPSVRGGEFRGGALELSRGLTDLVQQKSQRFAALANRMDSTHSYIYFDAILTGLTSGLEGTEHPSTAEQIYSVLRRIRALSMPASGQASARAIGSLANEDLPEDIVQLLCCIALSHSDPETDNWQDPDPSRGPLTQAINSARGTAAGTVADMLFADRSRWEKLRPAIEQIVEDRVLCVRTVAVNCLLAILDTHRDDALDLFKRLSVGSEAILGTPHIQNFLHYAIFRDYLKIRPILLRMLLALQPDVVRAGARLISLASLWVEEARGDELIVFKMGAQARAGAAITYANNLSIETVQPECIRQLRMLFMDECEEVRQEAGRCWINLNPDQVASNGTLIKAFTESDPPTRGVSTLVFSLKEASVALPSEVCDLAEHAVVKYGVKAGSPQFEEAGISHDLAPLLMRLYEEANDRELRSRVLSVLDEMLKMGFYGIEEQLRKQYDR